MKSTGMAPDTADAQLHDPLSVVFVSRYFHPFTGGLEKRVGALAEALAARSISVTVLTSRLFAGYPQWQERAGVIIRRFACPSIKIIGASVFIIRLIFFLIARHKHYQVVHAFQVGHSSGAAIVVARLLGKRAFLHLSGGGSGGDVGRHRHTLWGWLFLRLCGFASAIIVMTPEMQRELRVLNYPADRVVCIPNGVNTAVYQPLQDSSQLRHSFELPNAPIILYTGRLSTEKGLAVLLRARARMRSPSTSLLIIIGSGPEQQRLERLIRKLSLERNVVLLPSRTDIVPWYQCADIFVMPSFHEGMSNAVLEAMACALPVVATAVSGSSNLIVHKSSGLLVPPDEPAALAAALDELLDNPENARKMGAYGRHIVEAQYRFDTMIKRFCSLYDQHA
jgi:glycosyltransferase involved in cell wall biosynthesis